jgi:hypothetical protein
MLKIDKLEKGDKVKFVKFLKDFFKPDNHYPLIGSEYECTGEVISTKYNGDSFPIVVRWENSFSGCFLPGELKKIASRWEDILA